ncbi:MAG: GNAT family N-acetyltransferase [Nanoarchaeota archaeon]
MTLKVKIRPYIDADYEDVKKNLEDGSIYEDDWDAREVLKKKIDEHPGTILVAESDGCVVGNIYLVDDPFSPAVYRLAVRKEYRGHDIGRLLMDHAEQELKRRGHRHVMIFVNSDFDGLVGWYESQGYQYTQGKSFRCMWKDF